MSSPSDRLARLEAELAEMRATMVPAASPERRSRTGLLRRVALIGLALALIIPAGIVLAGGQTFTDVPPSHQFFNAIEAVAAAGVTQGCGDGTKYCPNGLVTRGQMAAFLSRLGALPAGSSPKVNADRVDGRNANEFLRVATRQISSTTPIPADQTYNQYGGDLTITAPTAGFVLVSGQLTFNSFDCTGTCWAASHIQHVGGDLSNPSMTTVRATDEFNATAPQGVFEVNAGVNTFRLRGARATGGGTVYMFWGSINAVFIPYGSTGGSTLGLTGDVPAMDVAPDAPH